jgi:chorismate synthase
MSTAGESHGPAEICTLSGVPAGLALTAADIDVELARRSSGYGRGGRMGIEADRARILAGVRLGKTLGSPITILVENRDHKNWLPSMSVEPVSAETARDIRPLTVPRPGHADFAGAAKFGHPDIRNVLERASARETVARVAGGAVCKRLLAEAGVTIRGRVVRIGEVALAEQQHTDPQGIDWEAVEGSDVACEDPATAEAMRMAIEKARDAGESLGGVFEIWCWGVCPGLGSYVTAEERLDALFMWALGSVPGVKGVEIGAGFSQAALPGSRVHDPFVLADSWARPVIARSSNNAGGLEGGVTNGMPLVLRAAMKPIPTLRRPLGSVDMASLAPVAAHVERSDVAAVPAARVVGEAMVAYVLARAYLAKFGGDSLAHFLGAVGAYEEELKERGLWRRS